MNSRITTLLLILMVAIAAPSAYAQFEGQITYEHYHLNASNGNKTDDGHMNLYITPNRILVNDLDNYSMGPIQSKGVLIRLDSKDFVFLTGDNQALQISKAQVVSMYNMMQGMSGSNGNNYHKPNIDVIETGEHKTIDGYKCRKVTVKDNENPNEQTDLWLTEDLDINWGMLTQPWSAGNQSLFPGSLPLQKLLSKGSLPLKVEHFVDGKLSDVIETSNINKNQVARAMVQIPAGVEVLSFQDYLMRQMSQ